MTIRKKIAGGNNGQFWRNADITQQLFLSHFPRKRKTTNRKDLSCVFGDLCCQALHLCVLAGVADCEKHGLGLWKHNGNLQANTIGWLIIRAVRVTKLHLGFIPEIAARKIACKYVLNIYIYLHYVTSDQGCQV